MHEMQHDATWITFSISVKISLSWWRQQQMWRQRHIVCVYLQALPQYGGLQQLWLAGHLHWTEGRRGTQGKFLSGGHVLRPGNTTTLRLHCSHTGASSWSMIYLYFPPLFSINSSISLTCYGVILVCVFFRGLVLVAMIHITPTSTVSGLTSLTSHLETTYSRWECPAALYGTVFMPHQRENNGSLSCFNAKCLLLSGVDQYGFFQAVINVNYQKPSRQKTDISDQYLFVKMNLFV